MAIVETEIVALAVSLVSTVLGGATSSDTIVKFLSNRFKNTLGLTSSGSIVLEDSSAGVSLGPIADKEKVSTAKSHLLKRIGEAAAQQRKSAVSSKVLHISSGLLTFSQYVIGGVMTLAFVKQQLSPNVVGVFGVVVFSASAINQKFSPGIGAEIASQKTDQFKALIRETEDKLIVIATNATPESDDPKPITDLLGKFSAEVKKIEAITKKTHKGG